MVMVNRSKKQQSKHDRKVRQLANQLKNEGWQVQADLPGYDQPGPIGKKKRIPDILAKKAGAERIIEVETSETINSDKDQHSTFRRRAGQKPRTKFEIEEA
jgi:Holliday junction resolvase